jgi:CO/xanthine dehydrogenase Mo-binding subunit
VTRDPDLSWDGGLGTLVKYGDISAGFAEADEIVEARLDTQLEQHFVMEPKSQIAYWRDNKLYVRVNTQYAHLDRIALASYFRMPVSDVIISTSLGGEGGHVLGMALGSKINHISLPIIAVMARKTGKAVKHAFTRVEEALNGHHRFPVRGYVKFGGKRDGTFTAMQGKFYIDVGAYGPEKGGDTLSDFYHAYTVPNVLLHSLSVNTNSHDWATFMRDVGESQGHFIMEVAIDMLAEKLGIDPVEFRLKNMRTKKTAVDPVTGFKYSSLGQPEAFLKAMNAFNWKARWKGWGVPSAVNGSKRRGVGVSLLNAVKGAISPPITGQVEVRPDGKVIFYTGLTDHGAGGNTAYAIMVAEALGLTSLENVTVIHSDTALTTDSGVTAGSRSTRVAGMAALMAVEDLKKQWFPVIASKLGVKPESLVFGDDRIYSRDDPSVGLTFKEAAALLKAPVKGSGVFTPPPRTAYRVGGAKFVELEVDVETGEVKVLEYVSGMDIGRVIFWKGAENQVRGGFYGMGMAEALYQERWNDPTTGGYLNPNFHDFRIPTIREVPDKVVATWEEHVDPIGPFGAKGIGENVLTGVSPAIANALSNALGGYKFTKLPITRKEIIEAIRWMRRVGKL